MSRHTQAAVIDLTRERLTRFGVTRYQLAARPTDSREQVDAARAVVRRFDPAAEVTVVDWTPGGAA